MLIKYESCYVHVSLDVMTCKLRLCPQRARRPPQTAARLHADALAADGAVAHLLLFISRRYFIFFLSNYNLLPGLLSFRKIMIFIALLLLSVAFVIYFSIQFTGKQRTFRSCHYNSKIKSVRSVFLVRGRNFVYELGHYFCNLV